MTNEFISKNGDLIDDWPCDVGEDGENQTNGSVECIYFFENRKYSVICDFELNPRFPKELAIEFNE